MLFWFSILAVLGAYCAAQNSNHTYQAFLDPFQYNNIEILLSNRLPQEIRDEVKQRIQNVKSMTMMMATSAAEAMQTTGNLLKLLKKRGSNHAVTPSSSRKLGSP